mgnify:CR=1 FL=1
MAILAWNDKELDVTGGQIYTFSGWNASSSFKTEEKKNGKKMPKSKAVSPGQGKVSFDVTLSYMMGIDVRAEYGWWRDECNKGTESLMYFGYQQYGSYKWRLIGVDQSGLETMRDGSWMKCRMSLTFEESFYKVKLSKLERKAQKLAKKVERQTKKAINAKSEAARQKAIQKAAAAQKELLELQKKIAEEKVAQVKKERETRKAIIDAIAAASK